MKNFLFRRWCILWCVLLVGVCSAQAAVWHDEDGIRVGDTVPAFSVTDNHGFVYDAEAFRDRPMVQVFFNTQCRDCRKELPELEKLYGEMNDAVRFLCISRAEPDSAVAAFWKAHNLSMPYSAQPDKRIFHLFARRTIPRVYVVGTAGVVRAKFVEHVSMRKLRRAIRRVSSEE